MRNIRGKRIVNPKRTSEKLHLELDKTYLLLDKMVEVEPVSESYRMYCEHCDHWNSEKYHKHRNVPEKVFCDVCRRELSIEDDLYVIFSD